MENMERKTLSIKRMALAHGWCCPEESMAACAFEYERGAYAVLDVIKGACMNGVSVEDKYDNVLKAIYDLEGVEHGDRIIQRSVWDKYAIVILVLIFGCGVLTGMFI